MADDVKVDPPAAPVVDPVAPPAAPAADAVRASEERWTKIEKQLGALTDVVQSSMNQAAQRVAQPAQGKPGEVPANYRTLLRQQGLSDADIDANAPLIIPFLSAMLATDGAVMLGGIQQVRDEIEMVKAGKNTKKFPYWGEVEETVTTLREDAAKNGRYLSVSDAYQAAVATDIASAESKIEGARNRQRAARQSDDVSANDLGPNRGSTPRTGVRRTAMSQEEIAALPRAERKKLIEEQFGDTPIR